MNDLLHVRLALFYFCACYGVLSFIFLHHLFSLLCSSQTVYPAFGTKYVYS